MKKIHISGSNVSVLELGELKDKLPVGNYDILISATGEIYLKNRSDLKMPEKELIDTSIAKVWLKSFKSNNTNLGVLMTGLKGSGKTVLAKKLCIMSDLPVLHLNSPIPCDVLSKFLSDPMFHNCIIFIDEFEKVINQRDEHIVSWLKLMDGGYNTKLLFLLTSNGNNISEFLMNRLSRIKYRKHFGILPEETINRCIFEFLEDKSFEEDLKRTISKVSLLSIDILVNIIDEINLFKQPASILVKNLNLISDTVYVKIEEFYENEWKYCDSKHFDFSDLKDEDFNRSWLSEEKKKCHRKIVDAREKENNNNIGAKDVFNEKDSLIWEMNNHVFFKEEPLLIRKKGIYYVNYNDSEYRFIPVVKSNMLF